VQTVTVSGGTPTSTQVEAWAGTALANDPVTAMSRRATSFTEVPSDGDARDGVSSVSRTSSSRLPWESRFTEAWPYVAAELQQRLRRRGGAAIACEDVVQETALRAWRAQPDFEDPDDLLRWCTTVGRRVLIDDHRRRSKLSVGPVPADTPANQLEPSAHLEAEELRGALHAAVTALPATQRASLTFSGDRTSASTMYVRRLRARARIGAAIEGMLGTVAWLHRRLHARSPGREVLLGTAVMTAVVGLVVVTSPVPSAQPMRPKAVQAAPEVDAVTGANPPTTERASRSDPVPPPGSPPPTRQLRERVRISGPTPLGRPAVIRVYEAGPKPLSCVRLPTIGIDGCVDYPLRP
jgi:RNA polymerase sigma factor (sigma-70 family)